MKVLRFDSIGGASGDMILGALVQLGADLKIIEKEIHQLIPEEKFSFKVEAKSEFGVTGKRLSVELSEVDSEVAGRESGRMHKRASDGGHGVVVEHASSSGVHTHGRTWGAIRSLLSNSALDEKTKNDSLAAFGALAEAEAEVHNVPVDDVHFHEVGAVDSIVDTVGCALGLNLLDVDGVSLSPLPVGEGTFRCAHGIYPVPAPAVACLLKKYALPVSYDVEPCEMLTPTAASLFAVWNKRSIPDGAEILASANSFGARKMKSRPNLLRAVLLQTKKTLGNYNVETLFELETNVDDASGERLAATASALFKAGALDVWFEPIQMKKGRPATRLCVLYREDSRSALLDVVFRYSGVFGARESKKSRYYLSRFFKTVTTKFGVARVKIGVTTSDEVVSVSPEYDDCIALSEATSTPFEEVYREVLKQFI